jgi:hypothetical protein
LHFPLEVWQYQNAGKTEVLRYLVSKQKYPWETCHASLAVVYAPCVGMAVVTEEDQIMRKLRACGKCHDWAVISLYLMPYNKFDLCSTNTTSVDNLVDSGYRVLSLDSKR